LFDDGLWEIKGNNITVKFNSGEIEEFKNISFENVILIINGVEQKYQRPKTKGEKLDEMIKKFFAIEGLSFSDPIDAEFNWNDENGEQTLIKGKMIKTELILSTDDYTDLSNLENKIVAFLKENGFESSEYNASENIDGYKSDLFKIIIKKDYPMNFNRETDENIPIKGEKAYIMIYIGVE
jgi:hypothetical protein